MRPTSKHPGQCADCGREGRVAEVCPGRGCRKRGRRFVPGEYLVALGDREPDPMVGRCVGDYLIVDLLGEGGFGRVYLALQLPILLKSALKLLRVEQADAGKLAMMMSKFEGEAHALAALNHPNIVRLLKYGIHDDAPYMVMEFVEGGRTLRSEVAKRAMRGDEFEVDELHGILRQLLDALAAAHERSIVHRDIKPENVMLQRVAGNPNLVRVLDFGLAKFVAERTETSMAMGTPIYMAPEQLTRRHIGAWTDLYAVGVICFELLTGRQPFVGRTHQELLARKLDDSYDPLTRLADLDIPPRVSDLFRRALARDHQQRFADASEMRTSLDEAFDAIRAEPNLSLATVDLTQLLGTTDLQQVDAQQRQVEEERRRLEEEKAALEAERERMQAERRRLTQERERLQASAVQEEPHPTHVFDMPESEPARAPTMPQPQATSTARVDDRGAGADGGGPARQKWLVLAAALLFVVAAVVVIAVVSGGPDPPVVANVTPPVESIRTQGTVQADSPDEPDAPREADAGKVASAEPDTGAPVAAGAQAGGDEPDAAVAAEPPLEPDVVEPVSTAKQAAELAAQADKLLAEGKLLEAKAAYFKCLAADVNFAACKEGLRKVEAEQQLAATYEAIDAKLKAQAFEDAWKELQKLPEIRPGSPNKARFEQLRQAVRLAYVNDEVTKGEAATKARTALKHFEVALAVDPDDERAKLGKREATKRLSKSSRDRKESKRPLKEVKETKGTSSKSASDFYKEGRTKQASGDLNGALTLYKAAARKGHARSWRQIGSIYLKKGDKGNACKAFKKYLKYKSDPTVVNIIKRLGC